MLSLFINCLLAIHVVVSLLIVFIVLMQRPKSEGLGAAFGGGMTENLFGAQTTNVLAGFTRWLGGIFFFLTLLLSILYAKQSTQHSSIQAAAIRAALLATPAASASPGNQHSTPVAPAASGSAAPFSTEIKLNSPAASPAGNLLPAPTLGATPAPAGSPFKAKPGLSGSAGH